MCKSPPTGTAPKGLDLSVMCCNVRIFLKVKFFKTELDKCGIPPPVNAGAMDNHASPEMPIERRMAFLRRDARLGKGLRGG